MVGEGTTAKPSEVPCTSRRSRRRGGKCKPAGVSAATAAETAESGGPSKPRTTNTARDAQQEKKRQKATEKMLAGVANTVGLEVAVALGKFRESFPIQRMAEKILSVVAPRPLPQLHAMHIGCHDCYGKHVVRRSWTAKAESQREAQIDALEDYDWGPLPPRACAECSFDDMGPCLRWVTDGWVTVEGVSLATARAYEGATIEAAIASITPPFD